MNPVQAPLVSVIIATYNRADLLRLTVQSVVAQTYPHVEIIVVDDGSTDHTSRIMQAFSDRVRYVHQENQGTDAALAHGYALATGDYINFLDHDDLMMPSKLAQQVRILRQQPEISLVHCGYHHIDEQGALLQQAVVLPDENPVVELLAANYIWSGAPLIRRTCLAEVGTFDESIWCSDWDLWLRIALAGHRFHCVQQPLGAYRVLTQSVMTNTAGLEAGVFATLDKAFAHPNLPPALHVQRSSIYGRLYFELSARYYTANDIDNGRRCLGQYIDRCTDEVEDGDIVLERVLNEIIKNPRVSDPAQVVETMLNFLPPNGDRLSRHRSRILAAAHISTALKHYQHGWIDTAQQHISSAVQLHPTEPQLFDDYAKLLAASAFSLPVADPFQYVAEVFDNLPHHAQRLHRATARVHGHLHIMTAFRAYATGDWDKVPGHVVRGALGQPASLKNKGLYAISLKSLQRCLLAKGGVAQSDA